MSSQERLSFRKILVVAQFAISIILILGTLTIQRQLDFMKNSDLGFDKENVLLVHFPFGDEEVKQKYPVLRDELLKNPNIVNVSGAYTVPGINSRFNISVLKVNETTDNAITIQALPMDFGFISSLDLQLKEGRDFSKDYTTDKNEGVILNESAVTVLGLENPIGQKLKIPGGRSGLKEVTVIGVVQDFHVQSLHNKINPILIYINPDMYLLAAVKIKPQNSKATSAFVKATWSSVFPNKEFNYRYLHDAYDTLYKSEEKTGKLLMIFTALALLVSCLGILGLASFMANKRIKEIGIRKVLGATTSTITILLSKQFSKWVVIANIFAWPIGYLIITKWMQNFAYKVTINVGMFILAAGMALMISLLTISIQTIKIAVANPLKALRYE
jgi:putative ABC transport system permease protein